MVRKEALAVILGLIPLGLAFGAIVTQAGFAWWWAPILSTVVYAGSMEFLVLSFLTNGVGVVAAGLSAFMVNARHIFYGLSYPPRPLGRARRAYVTYSLTDETYATLARHPQANMFALHVAYQLAYVGGVTVGALGGQLIPESIEGLDFILATLFTVLGYEAFQAAPRPRLVAIACALAVAAVIAVPNAVLLVALAGYFSLLVVRYQVMRRG